MSMLSRTRRRIGEPAPSPEKDPSSIEKEDPISVRRPRRTAAALLLLGLVAVGWCWASAAVPPRSFGAAWAAAGASLRELATGRSADKPAPQAAVQAAAKAASAASYRIVGDRAYVPFAYSADAADRYAAALNRFAKAAGPGVRVYSLLAPTAAAFVQAESGAMPASANEATERAADEATKGTAGSAADETPDRQRAAIAHIGERLDPGIRQVDAYGALEAHEREYVYFRTDHHWTALGAYYAYAELMKAMGEKPVALGEYESAELRGFLGTAYKATSSRKLKAHPDTIVYYKPLAGRTYTAYSSAGRPLARRTVDPGYAKLGYGDYALFLGGDFPRGEIETGRPSERRILVVKDSYGNALIPFLLPHARTVDYIDPRSYQGSLPGFVKEHRITDVVFLLSSTVARSSGIADRLDALMDE